MTAATLAHKFAAAGFKSSIQIEDDELRTAKYARDVACAKLIKSRRNKKRSRDHQRDVLSAVASINHIRNS